MKKVLWFCTYVLLALMVICSCNQEPVHQHSFSDDWSYDETNHWHAATCDHSEEKSDIGQHEWVKKETNQGPTCENSGIELYECSVCHAIKEVNVPKLGHTIIGIDAKNSTCSETGTTAHFECTRCSKFFSDSNGQTEISKESTIVEKKPHTLAEEEGQDSIGTFNACSVCGEKIYSEHHSYEKGICNECGYYNGAEYWLFNEGSGGLYWYLDARAADILEGEIAVPSKIYHLDDGAFGSFSKLTAIYLPSDSVNYRTIGSYAFKDCTSIESISIPRRYSLGEAVFYGWTESQIINYELEPNSELGKKGNPNPWYGCNAVVNAVVYTVIPDEFFRNYNNLQSCTIAPASESGVKYVIFGASCFEGCNSLKNLIIPERAILCDDAFRYWDSSQTIVINTDGANHPWRYSAFQTTMHYTEDAPFKYCDATIVLNYPNGLSIIDHTVMDNTSSSAAELWTRIDEINIPETVMSISSSAFRGLSNVTINFDKATDSISGAPWGATSVVVNWNDDIQKPSLPEGAKAIGGTIFHVNSSSTNTYTFYDSEGTEIDSSDISILNQRAKYYVKVESGGDTSEKYYVYAPGYAGVTYSRNYNAYLVGPGNEKVVQRFNYFKYNGSYAYVNGTTTYNSSNCTKTTIGSGRTNTNLLFNRMNLWGDSNSGVGADSATAAFAAYDLELYDGTTDWYLPSKDELIKLLEFVYANPDETVSIGYAFSYWSSSECGSKNPQYAWEVYCTEDGRVLSREALRSSKFLVRPVRSF